jgi:hypothetical protein
VRNTFVRGEHSSDGKSELSTRRSVPMADRLARELDRWSRRTVSSATPAQASQPSRSAAGSDDPSATTPRPRPHAPRRRSPQPRAAPHPKVRQREVMSPRPTERLPKRTDLQAIPYIGETGFEPATARPPARGSGFCSVAYPLICRAFLF